MKRKIVHTISATTLFYLSVTTMTFAEENMSALTKVTWTDWVIDVSVVTVVAGLIITIYLTITVSVFRYLTKSITSILSKRSCRILYVSFSIWMVGILARNLPYAAVDLIFGSVFNQLNFVNICDIFGIVWIALIIYCPIKKLAAKNKIKTNDDNGILSKEIGFYEVIGITSPIKRLLWVGTVAFGVLTVLTYLATSFPNSDLASQMEFNDIEVIIFDHLWSNRFAYIMVPAVCFVITGSSLFLMRPIERLILWIREG